MNRGWREIAPVALLAILCVAMMEARTLAEIDVVSAEHTTDALRTYGDVAYELGTVIGPIRSKEGELRTVTFRFMAMWRRQVDGAWRIAHLVGATVDE